MSSTQRIGNARATNEWGEDRARSGSWTGKAELKEEPGSQATALAFNGKGSWTNCDTQAECIQNLELMGLEVKDMVGKQYLSI